MNISKLNNKRILKGLVKCYDCKYALTYINNQTLTCSGYRTKGVCTHASYKEDEIIEIIKQHFERRDIKFEYNSEYLKQYIKKMYISKDGYYKIEFTDNSEASFNGYSLIL